MISFVSFKISGGVSIKLEVYIRGESARVLTIVILPLIDKVLCFHMINVFRSIDNFGLKLYFRFSSGLLFINIPSVSRGVLIQKSPCG